MNNNSPSLKNFSNYNLMNDLDLFGQWTFYPQTQLFTFSKSVIDNFFPELKICDHSLSELFDEKTSSKLLSVLVKNSPPKLYNFAYQHNSSSYNISLFNFSKNENTTEGFCCIIKNSTIDTPLVAAQNEAKFRTIGKMAGCIAHEISNPLSIIRMNAEILISSESLHTNPDKVKEKCEKIILTSDRVASIVRALRSINASTQKFHFTWVYLSDLAKDILELSKYNFKQEQIKITFNFNDLDKETFYLDYAQITQALINLINNSCDAIKDSNEKWILIECKIEEEQLIIEVTDSGECLPTDSIEKISSDLFSTKSANGLGLGLGLVQAYLSSHGGHLEYQPKNNNTSFTIYLPLDRIKPLTKKIQN